MNCDKCMMTGICKFEEDARVYEDALRLAQPADKPDCLEVFVKCENFKFKIEKPSFKNRLPIKTKD